MGYYLSAFDGVNIPIKAGDQDISSDGTVDRSVKVVGGAKYDTDGTAQSAAAFDKISCKAIITGSTWHIIQDALDPIKAKRGVRGTLTATMGDSSTRTRTAKLMEVKARRRASQKSIEVELIFQCFTAWKGAAHSDPVTIDANPKTFTVANGGNRRVTDAIITISVPGGGTPITALTVAIEPYISCITYIGTIAAGKSLVIDCGAMTVLYDGANSYANFSLDAVYHKIDDWLRLEPGNNSIKVTLTGYGGTSSTITVAFSDGWE